MWLCIRIKRKWHLPEKAPILLRHSSGLYLGSIALHSFKKMAPTDQLRRQQTCPKCRNHGIISKKKSHKKFCKYETCNCRHCILTDKRRQITKEQTALRRSQKEEEEMGLALPMSQSAFDNDVNLKNLNLLFPDKNISYLNAVLQRNANNLHAAIEKIRGAEGQNSCSSSSFDVKYEIGSPRRPPSWTQNYPSFNYYPPFHQYPQIPQVHPPIPPQAHVKRHINRTVPLMRPMSASSVVSSLQQESKDTRCSSLCSHEFIGESLIHAD
ncbi:hypothetical protein ScPMuIL_004789 [Solemya velum]